jgi:NhaP-type Na+/H+ or K+/H+ antiporter
VEEWGLAVVAGILLAYGLLSKRLEHTVVSAAIVFVTGGYLAGDDVLGWLSLDIDTGAVRVLAEATLTLVLFTDASRIDLRALRREVALPARLLGLGLPLTIVAGAALAAGVLTNLSLLEALVIAIVLAPTDAALGQAVVSDPRLPSRVRQGLNVESGLNDGICVPLLFIAIALGESEEGTITARHAASLVVEEIGWGVAGGALAGAVGAFALRAALRRGAVAHDWAQIVPMATAALAYGLAAPLGGSGFIAAFVGGLVFGAVRRDRRGEGTYLVEAAGQTLNAVTFVVFGAAVLGPALDVVDWQIALYAVLSLTVVRMAPVAIALAGTRARRPTVAYMGWFGPRGLASIVFAVIVLEEAELPHVETLVATVVITVAMSVFAHGLTAVPFTNRYVRWYRAHPVPPPMEAEPAHEHRVRRPVAFGRPEAGTG